mmetsp:Transcript_21379/g.60932  ORF Transcript_21379/g.60932 Transcript_21379/m.60932 type:complete len:212 (-) Transcript_21379:515-1150(-)
MKYTPFWMGQICFNAHQVRHTKVPQAHRSTVSSAPRSSVRSAHDGYPGSSATPAGDCRGVLHCQHLDQQARQPPTRRRHWRNAPVSLVDEAHHTHTARPSLGGRQVFRDDVMALDGVLELGGKPELFANTRHQLTDHLQKGLVGARDDVECERQPAQRGCSVGMDGQSECGRPHPSCAAIRTDSVHNRRSHLQHTPLFGLLVHQRDNEKGR